MDTIQLKKDDNGNIFEVVTSTTTQELPIDEAELIRQIEQHSKVVSDAQAKLEALRAFKDIEHLNYTPIDVDVPQELQNPIINDYVLAEVTTVADEPVSDEIKDSSIISE